MSRVTPSGTLSRRGSLTVDVLPFHPTLQPLARTACLRPVHDSLQALVMHGTHLVSTVQASSDKIQLMVHVGRMLPSSADVRLDGPSGGALCLLTLLCY